MTISPVFLPKCRRSWRRFSFVLEVALTPERRLAQADVATVREALGKHGFYLQLPKTRVLAGECDYD